MTTGPLTVLTYQYADSANHKTVGDIRLAGPLTPELRDRLRATLEPDGQFIPTQVCLEHLGVTARDAHGWSSFPCEDDHVWHTLFLARPDDIAHYELADTTGAQPASAFVERMEQAKSAGWDDSVAVEDIV